MPSVQHLSQKKTKILQPHKIQEAHKVTNSKKHLFSNLKPAVAKLTQSQLISIIPCSSCNRIYVGQTNQYLKDGISVHKNHPGIASLIKHELNTCHKIDYNDVSMLHMEENFNARCILEMMYIKKHNNTVYDRTDPINLSRTYHSLI